MAGKISQKGQAEENKIEMQALAMSITDLADQFLQIDSDSIAEDYADDNPRNAAVKSIDELRRGFYGPITERQDAQLVYIIDKLNKSEELDHHNDKLRQEERELSSQIKKKAYQLLHLIRGSRNVE